MDVIRLNKTCIYLTGTFPTDLISSYFQKFYGETSLLFCQGKPCAVYFLVLGRVTAALSSPLHTHHTFRGTHTYSQSALNDVR